MSEEKTEKKSFYRWLGDHLGRYPGGWFNQATDRFEVLASNLTADELAGIPEKRPLDMNIVRVETFSYELSALSPIAR